MGPIKAFQFSPEGENLDEIRKAYREDGCFIIRQLLDNEVFQKLKSALATDKAVFENNAFSRDGGTICMWNEPGNDCTGLVTRYDKIINIAEQVLEGEVYSYSSALVKNDGGQVDTVAELGWHQDYSHWYGYGMLKPDVLTAFIPLQSVDRTNGCLRSFVGSPQCGRLEHLEYNGVPLADRERITKLRDRLTVDYVEVKAGDIFFRNCNLLHASTPNTSPTTNYELISNFNRRDNEPVYPHHHTTPSTCPVKRVTRDEILACTNSDFSGKGFVKAPECTPALHKELARIGFH